MIDTVTITYKCNFTTWNICKHYESIKRTDEQEDNEKKYMIRDFERNGVQLFGYERKPDKPTKRHHMLEMRLNLAKLAYWNNQRVVCFRGTDKEFDMLKRHFNAMIVHIFGYDYYWTKPMFNAWRLSRIDFALDVEVPNVAEYIELIRKGKVPAWATVYTERNVKNHRKEPPKGGHYLTSGCVHWNIYDKEDRIKYKIEQNSSMLEDANSQKNEIIKQKINDLQKQLPRAQNILRIEIQVLIDKVRRIDKQKGYNRKWYRYLDRDMQYTLCFGDRGYLAMLEVNARYNGKEHTIKVIQEAKGLQKAVKQDMIDIVELLTKKRATLETVKQEYVNTRGYSKETFNNRLKQFEKIHVNPVTLNYDGELKTIWELAYDVFMDEIRDNC